MASGVVRCDWGPASLLDYFFTGLDKTRYILSNQNIPKKALIQMEEIERTHFYPNTTLNVACEFSLFLFLPYIKWAVSYRNGTKVLLPQSETDPVVPDFGDASVRKNFGYIRYQTQFTLKRGMTEIICLTPWSNSSTWMSTSRPINVKDKMSPNIDKTNPIRIFYTGEQNEYLLCNAKGYPVPEISWKYNERLLNLVEGGESIFGESTLKFPNVDATYDGLYTCIAQNEHGNDTFDFRVEVQGTRLSLGTILGIVVGVSVFGIVFVIVVIVYRLKYNDVKKRLRNLTKEEITEFTHGNPEAFIDSSSSAHKDDETVVVVNLYEKVTAMPFTNMIEEGELIVVKSVLGRGQFGIVYRGILRERAVAVKTVAKTVETTYFKEFLHELKLMAYIGRHDNIVEFLGADITKIEERIVYGVVELSPFGNLNNFLKKIDLKDVVNGVEKGSLLLSWCEQIACGMEFLETRKIIHSDLATRNVLLFENDVVKITDFGLSRQLYKCSSYNKKESNIPLPFAWMAIESLTKREFSHQSDVWSFGVTVWEIFSLGAEPFPGKLAQPYLAVDAVYQVMTTCWNLSPSLRPCFSDLKFFFQNQQIPHRLESERQIAVSMNADNGPELVCEEKGYSQLTTLWSSGYSDLGQLNCPTGEYVSFEKTQED